MGFLAVRTMINVDIWCLLLFHPNTAETGGDRSLFLSQSFSLSLPSISSGVSPAHCWGLRSVELCATVVLRWGGAEGLQSCPPQTRICSGIHTQLQVLTMRTQHYASVRTTSIITLGRRGGVRSQWHSPLWKLGNRTHLGRQENLELHLNNLPHSASGQG